MSSIPRTCLSPTQTSVFRHTHFEYRYMPTPTKRPKADTEDHPLPHCGTSRPLERPSSSCTFRSEVSQLQHATRKPTCISKVMLYKALNYFIPSPATRRHASRYMLRVAIQLSSCHTDLTLCRMRRGWNVCVLCSCRFIARLVSHSTSVACEPNHPSSLLC